MARAAQRMASLVCRACEQEIADGIPLPPRFPTIAVRLMRFFAAYAARATAALLGHSSYRYQPRAARNQFKELEESWNAESRFREQERRGGKRYKENDPTVYARPDDGPYMLRSRTTVLKRHVELLQKYEKYLDTFLVIANGRIYSDEYGDEVWEAADTEIDRLIDDKIFSKEGIPDREEFFSFEFLSRCEPSFGEEYSDCWFYDELHDRLKAYHQRRQQALIGHDPDKLSGVEFEQWLITLIKQAGVEEVLPTKRSGDQGADIIVRKLSRTIVIQSKYYSGSVGNAAVQEVFAAKAHYGADEAWVVSNSTLTKSARELAATSGVRLIDRSTFRDLGSLVAQAFVDRVGVRAVRPSRRRSRAEAKLP